MIVTCEVGFEAVDATQVDFAAGDHLEQDGKLPSGSGSANAFAGRRFGHVVARDTQIEHRGMALLGPQLTPVDGFDVPEQTGGVVLVLLNQVAELLEERLVTEFFERGACRHESIFIMGF